MAQVNLKQGSPEWVEFRKSKIGASDAPIIYGVSPWSSPAQLYKEKKGLSIPFVNKAMQKGIAQESEARVAYMNISGIAVKPIVFVSDEIDYMMASLDGYNPERNKGVEIKNPSNIKVHKMAQEGIIPIYYQVQMCHQLMTMPSLESIDYFSYFKGEEPALLTYNLDKELAELLKEHEKEFWSCLQDNIAPSVEEDEVSEDDSTDLIHGYQLIYEANRAAKRAEEWKALAKDRYPSSFKAKGIRISTSMRSGGVDKERLEQFTGIKLDDYQKPKKEVKTVSLYSK